MMLKPICAFVLAGSSVLLHAATWAPIPPEVWAMKEDPAKGEVGAVVLEDRLILTGTGVTHVFRCRVLSERGRSVAELPLWLPEANFIQGRTVQPDGTAIIFDQTKDFSQKTISSGSSDQDVKVVLPPGVTSNCVVELRWTDVAPGGEWGQLPGSLGYSTAWRLGREFKTREMIVEIYPGFHWACYVDAGTVPAPKVLQDGRHITYIFRDVMGLEPSPYSLPSLSGRPSVSVWKQPSVLEHMAQAKIDDYWYEAGRQWLKPLMWNHLKKGSAYAALAKELLAGLPADPAKAGEQLCRALDRRIMNQSYPTLEESGRLKKGETLDKLEPNDLEATASKGRTNGAGMTLMFLALAEQAGLHPRIAFVKDRSHTLMRYGLHNVLQLQDFLVGMPLAGGETLWLDPSLRFAPPGAIPLQYQGVEALVMDLDTWRPRAEMIPAQVPAFNQSQYKFKLGFEEGEELISLKAGFMGQRELQERRRYLAVSPEEANRRLQERMERSIRDATVTRASVMEVLNPDQNTHWELEAKREAMTGGTLRVDPFPGMPAPLWLPTAWPEHRTVPIVMNYLCIHEAECELRIPPGYALQPLKPYQKVNSFGIVQYTAGIKSEGGAGVVKVRFRVEVDRLAANAAAEPELRQFLGWVEECYKRELVLEKP